MTFPLVLSIVHVHHCSLHTCQTTCLSIPWYFLPTSSFVHLLFFSHSWWLINCRENGSSFNPLINQSIVITYIVGDYVNRLWYSLPRPETTTYQLNLDFSQPHCLLYTFLTLLKGNMIFVWNVVHFPVAPHVQWLTLTSLTQILSLGDTRRRFAQLFNWVRILNQGHWRQSLRLHDNKAKQKRNWELSKPATEPQNVAWFVL